MVEDGNVEMSLEDLIPYIISLRRSSQRCDPVKQNAKLTLHSLALETPVQ